MSTPSLHSRRCTITNKWTSTSQPKTIRRWRSKTISPRELSRGLRDLSPSWQWIVLLAVSNHNWAYVVWIVFPLSLLYATGNSSRQSSQASTSLRRDSWNEQRARNSFQFLPQNRRIGKVPTKLSPASRAKSTSSTSMARGSKWTSRRLTNRIRNISLRWTSHPKNSESEIS